MSTTKPLLLYEESDLPEGWGEMRVGDYFESWGGMTPSTSEESYWGGKVPWVSSKDIKQWRISRGQELITKKALTETRLRLCPVGSVLVVVRSGILAHTLPIAVADGEVTINQDLKAFWCPKRELNEWLALALRAVAPKILEENRKDEPPFRAFDTLNSAILRFPSHRWPSRSGSWQEWNNCWRMLTHLGNDWLTSLPSLNDSEKLSSPPPAQAVSPPTGEL